MLQITVWLVIFISLPGSNLSKLWRTGAWCPSPDRGRAEPPGPGPGPGPRLRGAEHPTPAPGPASVLCVSQGPFQVQRSCDSDLSHILEQRHDSPDDELRGSQAFSCTMLKMSQRNQGQTEPVPGRLTPGNQWPGIYNHVP